MTPSRDRAVAGQDDFLLLDDEPTLNAAAGDWGRLVRHRPRAVLRPAQIGEIVAAQRQFSLVPRGQGHSTNATAQSEGGVVVDMGRLKTVHEVQADRVVVDAGARWSDVLRATCPHGLTPPVLTDYLELSIGGTLSVGGIGGATNQYGLQTDNVIELEVVTPGGELVRCSATNNPEVFDAVRGGHGRHGIIARATLRLVPAHSRVHLRRLFYRDLASFLVDQRRLVTEGRFHYLEGQALPDESGGWYYVIEAAVFHSTAALNASPLFRDLDHASAEIEDVAYFDFLNRMAPQEADLRALGAWYQPHPWVDLFLPDAAATEIIRTTMAGLGVADVGDTGVVLIYPFRTARIETPGVAVPSARTAFLFSLLRTGPPNDPATVERMVRDNERLRRTALAHGGTVYLDP